MMSDFIDFTAFDYASDSKVYNDAFDEYLESLSYQDITGHDFYDNCSYSEDDDDDDPNDPKGGGKRKRKKKDDNSGQGESAKCSKTQGKNSSNSSCCAPPNEKGRKSVLFRLVL